MRNQLQRHPILPTALALVAMYAAACVAYPGFFSLRVIANMFTDSSFLGISALGMTAVILSRGIDLSVGSVMGFTTVLVASLIERSGLPAPLAWLTALAVGALFGAFMGWLIVAFDLPAFLVTLGGLFFAKGLGYALSGQSIGIADPVYDAVLDFNFRVGPRAYLGAGAFVFIGFALLVGYLMRWTRFGRYVYAVGGNAESARLMGLPVDRVRIGVYAFNGFCSALAGIVMTFYIVSGNPLNGVGLELDAIAAVVVGGTLLSGGVGGPLGTLLGLLIFATIQTMMNFDGRFDPAWMRIAVAGLLLAFILAQRMLIGRRAG